MNTDFFILTIKIKTVYFHIINNKSKVIKFLKLSFYYIIKEVQLNFVSQLISYNKSKCLNKWDKYWIFYFQYKIKTVYLHIINNKSNVIEF